jgi:hypothetical protein
MEKNKKIIVIAAFVIGISLLMGFIYLIYFKEMKENKKSKFEFDVPEFSNKKDSTSKFEYYKSQIDQENIEKGFLLEKEDSIKEALKLTEEESFYEKEDFQDTHVKDYQNDLSGNNKNKVQNQENLSRLLSVMESNSKYLNNSGKAQSTINDFQSRRGSSEGLAFGSIEDMPEKIDKDLVKDVIEKHMQGKEEHTTKSEKSSGRNIYKENSKEEEDVSKNIFFGVTKNKNIFNGVISDTKSLKKELVKAEIYTTQIIGNGGLVMINLLEDLFFEEDFFIPKSTVLYGTVKFSPGRMFISISPNVFKNDKRLLRPVIVFDFDGLEGVFVETNLLGSIPVETARELTELVKDSYKNANPLSGSSTAVPLKEASIIIGSEKIIQYLNRLKLKIAGGYKIWISVEKNK